MRLLLQKKPDVHLSFSDHLSYIGAIFEQLPAHPRFISIDSSHVVASSDEAFDAVTCIHKIEFTPEWERLIQEAYRVLKPGGRLFVSTMQPSFLKYLIDSIRACIHAPRFRPNVYDGNPFYKIGPFAVRDLKQVMDVGRRTGFDVDAQGVERVSGGGAIKHVYGWIVFSKK